MEAYPAPKVNLSGELAGEGRIILPIHLGCILGATVSLFSTVLCSMRQTLCKTQGSVGTAIGVGGGSA